MSHKPRVLGSIPDFSRLLFLRPSHYFFFSPMDIGKGQSDVVVDGQPGNSKRDWLEPLQHKDGEH